MSRILFAPETFNLGETSRGVEVARELARRGYDVLFMGYSRGSPTTFATQASRSNSSSQPSAKPKLMP
nr:hypothetical protein [Pseudoclavibacter sp. Marseille-Q3772]